MIKKCNKMNPTRFLMNCNNIPHDCEKIDKKRQNMIWEKHEDHNENIKNKKKLKKKLQRDKTHHFSFQIGSVPFFCMSVTTGRRLFIFVVRLWR